MGFCTPARRRKGVDAYARSALNVVTPAAAACSEYRLPSASSASVSDLDTCVEDRWTIVTSAPTSHSAAQISCAELPEPITTARLPRYASGPTCSEEWCCSPAKTSMP